MCQGFDGFKFSTYPSTSQIHGTNSDYYAMLFDQGQIAPLESDMSLTVAQKQKFRIQEISPEWGYATETTKVSFYYSVFSVACKTGLPDLKRLINSLKIHKYK